MFLFSYGGHYPPPPFVFENNQHGPKRVIFVVYVTFSTFAVLCSDAFTSHLFPSVGGWSPNHQRGGWSFEAVFGHSDRFIKEPDRIRRLTNKKYSRWAATESVCDQKWFSLRSWGVHGPKPVWMWNGGDFFPPSSYNQLFQSLCNIFYAHLGPFWF